MAIDSQRFDRWEEQDERDQAEARRFRPLTRAEAQALRAKEPPLSPWRVVALQCTVGIAAALLAAPLTGRVEMAWSLLYGAAAVAVPAALMARGMTSPLLATSPGASAAGFLVWEMVKIAVSVAMLMLAPKIVQPLSWPALLVGLVLGMACYVAALAWRGRKRMEQDGSRHDGS